MPLTDLTPMYGHAQLYQRGTAACCACIRQLLAARHAGRNSSLLGHWHHTKHEVTRALQQLSADLLEAVDMPTKRHALQHKDAFADALARA